MSTKYWIGGAAAVAQVAAGSIDSLDGTPGDNTFTVTIGGVSISTDGDTDVATTAAALVALLNASTHPYFAAITWANPSSGNITATADTAGVPFEAALTETGVGSGAVTDFSDTTASEGPCDFSTPENWSDGAVPAGSDTVIFANSSVNCVYGLDQNSLDLTLLEVEHTFTGELGLPSHQFTTSADGNTTDSSVPEYREHYLKIGADTCHIGRHNAVSTPAGSGRIKFNNDKAGSSVNTVHRTATAPADAGFPAVQLLAGNSGADFFVREGRGGVGFATGAPAETATVGDITVSASGTESRVFISNGVTLTNYTQLGGANHLNAAATITAVTVKGGTLTLEGDYTVTTLTIEGGTVYDNHIKTGGNAVATCNLLAGRLDLTRSAEARTLATLHPDGGTLVTDDDYITITTLDAPADRKTLAIS